MYLVHLRFSSRFYCETPYRKCISLAPLACQLLSVVPLIGRSAPLLRQKHDGAVKPGLLNTPGGVYHREDKRQALMNGQVGDVTFSILFKPWMQQQSWIQKVPGCSPTEHAQSSCPVVFIAISLCFASFFVILCIFFVVLLIFVGVIYVSNFGNFASS